MAGGGMAGGRCCPGRGIAPAIGPEAVGREVLRMGWRNVAAALAAGGAATVAMTVAMEAMYRRLPPGERAPLPPRQITIRAAAAIGLAGRPDESVRVATSMVLHAGYGMGTGAVVFALLRRRPGAGVGDGVLAGLAVYLLGYAGWLPLLRLYPPIPRETLARNGLTIAAHVVWGAALGGCAKADMRLSSFRAAVGP